MRWIDRLKGTLGGSTGATPDAAGPTAVDLIPGELRVRVMDHPLQPDPQQADPHGVNTPAFPTPAMGCRAYLSEGLARVGQREVMFVLAHDAGHASLAHEASILEIMHTLHALAREGRFVQAGDVTIFGDNAPFGIPRCGLAYVDAFEGSGQIIPRDALLAIYLHPDECRASEFVGAYRALAWLANAYRLFPQPIFSEPGRGSAVPTGMVPSRLADVPRLAACRGAEVFLSGGALTLRMDADKRGALDRLIAATEQHRVVCVFGGRVPAADVRLMWQPAQVGLHAVGGPGATMAIVEAGFVLLAGGQEANDYRPTEDGFLILVTDDDWSRIRQAIASGTDAEVAMDGDGGRLISRFRIEFSNPP